MVGRNAFLELDSGDLLKHPRSELTIGRLGSSTKQAGVGPSEIVKITGGRA